MPEEEAAHRFRAVCWVSPTQQVREQLLDAIHRGDLAPGAALPSERELCEVFGVSRVSVRQALAGLEAMGLITIQHGRGAYVSDRSDEQYLDSFARYLTMHRDQLVELLAVRGALDELAAQDAATAATPAALDHLVKAHEAFRSAAQEKRPRIARVAELDVAFHLSIAEIPAGALLPLLLKDLNSVLSESRLATLSRPGQLALSVQQHQKIMDAILARNAEQAGREAADHVRAIREWAAQHGRS